MPIIGFLAKRRSGKDTASDYIVKKYGYTKKAFADSLKKSVQQLFGFTDSQLYTDEKEKIDPNWGVSPRRVFQVFGTDIIRELFPKLLLPGIGSDFHIKRFDIWYRENKDKNIVISDVRFQNEVDYIRSIGGVVLKIKRPNLDLKENADLHKSESGIDSLENYNGTITNNGSLKDLYEKLDEFIYDLETAEKRIRRIERHHIV